MPRTRTILGDIANTIGNIVRVISPSNSLGRRRGLRTTRRSRPRAPIKKQRTKRNNKSRNKKSRNKKSRNKKSRKSRKSPTTLSRMRY